MAFSTTSLTEFEYNHLSGLVEIDLSLFAEILKFFFSSLLSVDKTSKKVDRYLGNKESGNIKVYAQKFPPMTLIKVCPFVECNI